ncbi:hypothetical protein FCM35_KLT17579 [Carex littledalei]|uniref:Uncharacterized protein n=1 Tax=Carex littledalei TaxID=544730 RepID=A0A833VGA9_9POAL|nr:hypothetical protein FCM35_KLT17579 [Carex littledalei]
MPVLRKALIKTSVLMEEWVPALCGILKSITNVSELTLHIGDPYPTDLPRTTRGRKRGYKGEMISDGSDIFHPLVEPGKDMLILPNLRSLKLSMCFYENALQDLICLLHHSPVIDSLHLIHMLFAKATNCFEGYLMVNNRFVLESKSVLVDEQEKNLKDSDNAISSLSVQ